MLVNPETGVYKKALLSIETGVYKKALLSIGGIIALVFSATVLGEMTTSERYGFLPLGLISGLLGTFFILRRPLVGFALLFFFVSLAPITRVTTAFSAGGMLLGGSTISSLIALLLTGIFISRVFLTHEKIKIDRLFLLICAFVSWGVITTLWAYDAGTSLVFIFRIVQMAILYILVLNYCRSQKQLDVFILSFVLGTIIAAAIPVLTDSANSSDGVSTRATLSSDPNFFAAGVGIGMILIFNYLRKTGHNLGKIVLILGLIFTSYLIIRAQSRGVWIALSASFLISTILMSRHKKSIRNAIKISALLIGLFISAYFVGIIDKDVISRFETLSDNPEVATSHRSDIWNVGLKIIIDTFPLGVGFKNFEIAYQKYVHIMNVGYIHSTGDPHNAFIAVLAETGLVGFAIFVGIFIYLFKDVRRIMNPIERFTYMWLLAYLVLVSSSLSFHYTSWFWAALIFIGLGAKFSKQSTLRI